MTDIKQTTSEIKELGSGIGSLTDGLNSLGAAGSVAKQSLVALEAPSLAVYNNVENLTKVVDKALPDALIKASGGLTGLVKLIQQTDDFFLKLRATTLSTVGAFDQGIGTADRLTEALLRTQIQISKFGGTTQDAAAQFILLNQGLRVLVDEQGGGFERFRVGVATTITQLERLGVSKQQSIGFLKDLNILFRQSPSDFNVFSRTIGAFADQTGQRFSDVFVGAQQNLRTFAEGLSSEETLSKFLRFQLAAQRTGLQINSLKGIFDKFDTIEGAQRTGGRLAALFRQYGVEFNATAFAFKTQEEQQQILSQKSKEFLQSIAGENVRTRRLLTSEFGGILGVSAADVVGLARGQQTAFDRRIATGGLGAVTQQQFAAQARAQLAADRQKAAEAAGQAAANRIALAGLEDAGTSPAEVARRRQQIILDFDRTMQLNSRLSKKLGSAMKAYIKASEAMETLSTNTVRLNKLLNRR